MLWCSVGVMRGRTIILIATALLLVSLGPAPAWADRKAFRDGNDTRGALDIARVTQAHRNHRLVHTMRLHRAWPVKKIGNHAFAMFYFQLRGHGRRLPERTVQIDFHGGRLVAHMFDTLVKPAQHLGRVTLRRPSWRTLRVSFPKSMLRPGLQGYKWNAATHVERGWGSCRQALGCTDWAPDRRVKYVRHVL